MDSLVIAQGNKTAGIETYKNKMAGISAAKVKIKMLSQRTTKRMLCNSASKQHRNGDYRQRSVALACVESRALMSAGLTIARKAEWKARMSAGQ